eukprot:6149-Heterococcus_DN1.PRE.3
MEMTAVFNVWHHTAKPKTAEATDEHTPRRSHSKATLIGSQHTTHAKMLPRLQAVPPNDQPLDCPYPHTCTY